MIPEFCLLPEVFLVPSVLAFPIACLSCSTVTLNIRAVRISVLTNLNMNCYTYVAKGGVANDV